MGVFPFDLQISYVLNMLYTKYVSRSIFMYKLRLSKEWFPVFSLSRRSRSWRMWLVPCRARCSLPRRTSLSASRTSCRWKKARYPYLPAFHEIFWSYMAYLNTNNIWRTLKHVYLRARQNNLCSLEIVPLRKNCCCMGKANFYKFAYKNKIL